MVAQSVLRSQSFDERSVVVRTLRNSWFVFSLTGWAEHRKLPSLYFRFKRNLIKMCHELESMKTIVDLGMSQTADAFSAKLLDVERRHHGAKDHCASHRAFVQIFLARQVSHKTTRKRVAGASWIKHRFERVSGNREVAV